MIDAPLSAALAAVFPGWEQVANPIGLARLAADYGDGIAPYDLEEWVRRRFDRIHPAFGLNDQLTERHLDGMHKTGVPAASIDTVQAHDGLWYVRHSASFGGGGWATPITHSDPFDTEADAIAWAAAKLIEAAQRRAGGDTEARWARKIEAWAKAQIDDQGKLAL